ncbi:MAG: nuclear transport factor 2 family protein [Dehalococcoidia bacterium]
MTRDQILELGQRWADAEGRNDADALEQFVADDFAVVGPLGFVLDRQQYLEPRRNGVLKLEGHSLNDVSVRDYGATAIAVGIVSQKSTYQGQPAPQASGRFRVTQVAVQRDGRWLLANIQYSGPIPDMPPRQG